MSSVEPSFPSLWPSPRSSVSSRVKHLPGKRETDLTLMLSLIKLACTVLSSVSSLSSSSLATEWTSVLHESRESPPK